MLAAARAVGASRSSASRTGRRLRRTPCSSGRARGRRSSPPRVSSTCSTCAARPRAPLPAVRRACRSRSFRSSAATACASASGRTGCSCRSTLDSLPELEAPRRSPSACSSRSATRRTSGRSPRSFAAACRTPTSSRRTRWRRSSASTSALRRRPRTPTSARSARATCARSRPLPSRRVCPSRSSCAPPAAWRRWTRRRSTLRWSSSRARRQGSVGAALAAGQAGIENAISFDMGGTSTDVCLIAGGRAERTLERSVGGLPIRLPMVDIHTVGAGGGSIVWRDAGGALRVGPGERRGRSRPRVLRARRRRDHGDGREPPPRAAARTARRRPRARPRRGRAGARRARPGGRGRGSRTPRCCARCASSRSSVVTTRATSPSSPSGAQGRCTRARSPRSSGFETVLVPAAAGVLSALGLVASDERRDQVRSYVCPLEEAGELPAEGEADLRYRGQSFELAVAARPRPRGALSPCPRGALRLRRSGAGRSSSSPCARRRCARGPSCELGGWWPLDGVPGPAVLELEGATCWLPPGWVGVRDGAIAR